MDREKVIKGLECHQINKDHRINCLDCPYHCDEFMNGLNELHNDALSLLKEQETLMLGGDSGMCEICSFYERSLSAKPSIYHHLFICPICKNALFREQKFCHECGKRIKWEDGEVG